MKKYYIAYGSNTLEEQMKRRCPDSRLIGTAMLDGFELQFQGTATVVPKQGAWTPVLIWETKFVWTFARMFTMVSIGKKCRKPKSVEKSFLA